MSKTFLTDWMGKHASRIPAWRRGGAALSCALLVAGGACGLVGCKDTDLFTDVIISPYATEVDEDNEVHPVINTPGADKKDETLATLDLVEESKTSMDVEMVATYSKDPTSSLEVHHSVFDLDPRLPGIEASDTVKLVYSDTEEAADEEVTNSNEEPENTPESRNEEPKEDEQEQQEKQEQKQQSSQKDESASESKSGSQASSDADDDSPVADDASDESSDSGSEGSSGEDSGSGSEGSGGGDEGSGGEGGTGEGDNEQDQGDSRVKGGGYGDNTEPVYNPGDRMQEVQHADHIAAMGQAAVVVQAIGGRGALCAMDEDTYLGRDENNKAAKTASSFKDVFADELAEDFEDSAILWSDDGTSSSDIKDFDALVEAVGANGVILYLGEYGDQSKFFNKQQLEDLEYASIQLVPVDLSTVQGILDATEVVGEILSESEDLDEGWDSVQMAKDYKNAVKNIVKAVAATNGGNLAAPQSNATTTVKALFTTYNALPVSQISYFDVGTIFITDYEAGVSFTDQYVTHHVVNTELGVGFTHVDYTASPVSFWAQCAGVVDAAARVSTTATKGQLDTDIIPVWQYGESGEGVALPRSCFSGYSSTGPFSKWTRSRWLAMIWKNNSYSGNHAPSGGLGTKYFPYLICCDNSTMTAGQVEEAVEESIGTKNSTYYAYDIANGEHVLNEDGTYEWDDIALVGQEIQGPTGDLVKSNAFRDGGVSAEDAVVENPHGLVSTWTEGTLESVLESVWTANLYSKSPNNCAYTPITDMSGYSCTIGGTTCKSLEETVEAFYSTFYRYSLGSDGVDYSDVVEDEGPQE